MPNTLILCDCLGSQTLDPTSIEKAGGVACSRVHHGLCAEELGAAGAYLEAGNAIIACQQERRIFEELADELGCPMPLFVDLRDRAGWADDGAKAGPKMAALVAESTLEPPEQKVLDITSFGQCLVLGPEEAALDAAARLGETLSVTVLLEQLEEPPIERGFDLVLGTLRRATGSLGRFDLRIDALQTRIQGGRGTPAFSAPKDGGQSSCDLILDLRNEAPLFAHKRDGYLRADPKNRKAFLDAIIEAGQMVGTFEKPLYVAYDPLICAHSRSGIQGCSNCVNACESGAIAPDGEQVRIDPLVCAGCGDCSAVCPSGAINFQAAPFATLLQRLQAMATAFRAAGGKTPRLLVHDAPFGEEMISLAARFGRGLPHDVVPLRVESLAAFGHAEMLAALGFGFASVSVLCAPDTGLDVLQQERDLAAAISGTPAALHLLTLSDPDALSDTLYNEAARPALGPVVPMGTRRQVTRLVARALHPQADAPLPLPPAAPYGAVHVDQGKCTLCLSCVSLCPSGALHDNEDKPQLRFQEDACLQCGLCQQGCPEQAISLQPQLDLSDAALGQTILHEEEPFACISCGALFGVKSTVERVVDMLAGKHAMFAESDSARLIQMCDTCRIEAQFKNNNDPFKAAPRPRTRTTDDDLKQREP